MLLRGRSGPGRKGVGCPRLRLAEGQYKDHAEEADAGAVQRVRQRRGRAGSTAARRGNCGWRSSGGLVVMVVVTVGRRRQRRVEDDVALLAPQRLAAVAAAATARAVHAVPRLGNSLSWSRCHGHRAGSSRSSRMLLQVLVVRAAMLRLVCMLAVAAGRGRSCCASTAASYLQRDRVADEEQIIQRQLQRLVAEVALGPEERRKIVRRRCSAVKVVGAERRRSALAARTTASGYSAALYTGTAALRGTRPAGGAATAADSAALPVQAPMRCSKL